MPKLYTGDKMQNFNVVTSKGEHTTIFNISDGKPTILLALRWIGCSLSRLDIHDFSEFYPQFEENGVRVIVILQSSPETVTEHLNGLELPFTIVCDEKQDIYKTLDIHPAKNKLQFSMKGKSYTSGKRADAKKVGFSEGEVDGNPLQLPAFFYFDQYRVIIEAYYGKHPSDIPYVERFLENL